MGRIWRVSEELCVQSCSLMVSHCLDWLCFPGNGKETLRVHTTTPKRREDREWQCHHQVVLAVRGQGALWEEPACFQRQWADRTNKSPLGCQASGGLDMVSHQLPWPLGAAGSAGALPSSSCGLQGVGICVPPAPIKPRPASPKCAQAKAVDGRHHSLPNS